MLFGGWVIEGRFDSVVECYLVMMNGWWVCGVWLVHFR